MRRLILESDKDSEKTNIFQRNFKKFTKQAYRVDQLPKLPSFPKKWQMIHVDCLLTLHKYFRKKYMIEGGRDRVTGLIDKIGVEKFVRVSTVYPPYKIIRASVLYSKFKNSTRLPRVFQYKNKFFPFDREDLHLMAVDLVQEDLLLGPCKVVNLTGATQQDIGDALGNVDRMADVFKFLEVPSGDKDKPDEKDIKDTDAQGNPLTKYQLDLFNKGPADDSVDLGFKTPLETDISIKQLNSLDDEAHKVRATLLMIQRARAALKNTKDKKKKKNLTKSLKKWLQYKKSVIDK